MHSGLLYFLNKSPHYFPPSPQMKYPAHPRLVLDRVDKQHKVLTEL